MAIANSASKRKQPHFHLASGSDHASGLGIQALEVASLSDLRNSVELQTLLKSSPEDGPSSSQQCSDDVPEQGDSEVENNARSISRVISFSKSYTDEEEKAVVRKFDRRLVLFMALLYMLSFLDRSNIGNARIAGLETSLPLQPGQYAWLLTAFYITYISFEWMTFLYQIIPPHIYISLCVMSWGLIASLQSVSTSFTSLVIFRALLGVAEAAFGPGVPFYLSFFYKRSELAYRVGLFISAAPLAISCASTVAWLIVKLSRHGPLEPWRALFLIEGFPSIIVAFFAWHIIPDSPSTAKYLTPRERKVAKLRILAEEEASSISNKSTTSSKIKNEKKTGLSLRDLLHTLLDPAPYLTALMFFSANVSFSSLPVFLPTILQSTPTTTTTTPLSPLTTQLLTAPPYLLSFLTILLLSHLSDRTPNSRGILIILASLFSSLSYTTIALAGHYHLTLGPSLTFWIRYLAVFGAAMGFFPAVTLIITWTLNNQRTDTGKGAGLAMLNVVGQCGPLVGTRLYPEGDGPYFVRGMLVCAGFMAAVAVLAGGLRCWLGRVNRRGRDRMMGVEEEEEEDDGDENGEEEEEGWAMDGDVEMVELGEDGVEEEGEGDDEGRNGREGGAEQRLIGSRRRRRSRRRKNVVQRRFEYML